MIDISEQNLEDSAFNLEQFIRDEATDDHPLNSSLLPNRNQQILTKSDAFTCQTQGLGTLLVEVRFTS